MKTTKFATIQLPEKDKPLFEQILEELDLLKKSLVEVYNKFKGLGSIEKHSTFGSQITTIKNKTKLTIYSSGNQWIRVNGKELTFPSHPSVKFIVNDLLDIHKVKKVDFEKIGTNITATVYVSESKLPKKEQKIVKVNLLQSKIKKTNFPKNKPTLNLNDIVNKNQGIIMKIAKHYVKKNVQFEDLIQAGNLGIIEAANRFDASRGNKFITYAVPWIKKFIKEEVQKSHTVPVTEYTLNKIVEKTGEGIIIKPIHDIKNELSTLGHIEESSLQELIDSKDMCERVEKLPSITKNMFMDVVHGKTFKEISLQNNCSVWKIKKSLIGIKKEIFRKG
jgi:RNA polymerase sigma factor (sigma-70 family)